MGSVLGTEQTPMDKKTLKGPGTVNNQISVHQAFSLLFEAG